MDKKLWKYAFDNFTNEKILPLMIVHWNKTKRVLMVINTFKVLKKRKVLLFRIDQLLEINLKFMDLWGTIVRRMDNNHVKFEAIKLPSYENRHTPKLSGFLVAASTVCILSHHSEKRPVESCSWRTHCECFTILYHPQYILLLDKTCDSMWVCLTI